MAFLKNDFLHTKNGAHVKIFVLHQTLDHRINVLQIKFEVPVSSTCIFPWDKNDKNA